MRRVACYVTVKAVYPGGRKQGGSHFVRSDDPDYTLCGMPVGGKANKSWTNCSGCFVAAKRAEGCPIPER